MGWNLDQAKHNLNFLKFIEGNTREEEFCDWKIIIIFYITYHLLKDYAKFKKTRLGYNHKEIKNNLNPNGNNPSLPLDEEHYDYYDQMYDTCQLVRYKEKEIHRRDQVYLTLKAYSYKRCRDGLIKIKEYLKSKGLNIPSEFDI